MKRIIVEYIIPEAGQARITPHGTQEVKYNEKTYLDYLTEEVPPLDAIYVAEMLSDGSVVELIGAGISNYFPHCFSGWDIKSSPENSRFVSVQKFRDRFTSAETDAFIDATRIDNNVAKMQFQLSTAQEPLDLDGETLQQGMLYLVALNIITEARRIEILI